eukprot:2114889-Amphidinium_carterae.1
MKTTCRPRAPQLAHCPDDNVRDSPVGIGQSWPHKIQDVVCPICNLEAFGDCLHVVSRRSSDDTIASATCSTRMLTSWESSNRSRHTDALGDGPQPHTAGAASALNATL